MLERIDPISRNIIYNSKSLKYISTYSFDFEDTLKKIDDILFKESNIEQDIGLIYTLGYRFPTIYNSFNAMYIDDKGNRKRLDSTNPEIFNKKTARDIFNENDELIISRISILEDIYSFKPFYSIHAAKLMTYLFDFYYEDINSNYGKVLRGDPLNISDSVTMLSLDVHKCGCPIEYISTTLNLDENFARSVWDYYSSIFDKHLYKIILDNAGDFFSLNIHTDRITLTNHGSIKAIRYAINEYVLDTDEESDEDKLNTLGFNDEEKSKYARYTKH